MAYALVQQPIDAMQRHESGFTAALEYAQGAVSYEKTVVRLSRIGQSALSTIAEVQLQEAANTPRRTEELLSAAESTLEQRVYSQEMGFDPKAAIRLAQMGLYRSILGNPKFPSRHTVEQSHQMVIEAAMTAATHHMVSDTKESAEDILMFGTMAEASVGLLLTNYALKNNLTDLWLPVMSFLNEDISVNSKKAGWDISVYIADRKFRPTLGYKMQVKASPRFERIYNRDIAVVNVNPDLAAANEPLIKSSTIIAECQIDAQPSKTPSSVTKRLNSRTHKLLTILDRV